MEINKYCRLIIHILLLFSKDILSRSIFRPQYSSLPKITSNWQGEEKYFSLRHSYLEEPVIFDKFDSQNFNKNLLPHEKIYFRTDSNRYIDGDYLDKLINNFIEELYNHKKKFKDFDILKKNDFNFKSLSGNLILKFNDYPFILKLFIETPESFTKPYSKGWGPSYLFFMGGGISRYLCGFTRIKNLEIIKEKINKDPHFSQILDFPRKWFWLPKDNKYFDVNSENIGQNPRTIKLPSIYGIVADFINQDAKPEITTDFALKLSYYLDNRLDPHSNNFIREKETGKIVIIDTEHFPSMVGLTDTKNFNSYLDWYLKLGAKCFKDMLLRNKEIRNNIKINSSPILRL